MSILDKVNSPKDIKFFDMGQLRELAGDIRQLILDVVLNKGGHLSSNLGVVETIIALHYVFDFDKDRLILDVGHQCYAHKILTGRRDSFATLRSKGGVAGFPKREESVYDAADTGHSSTSVSLACGMLRAKDKSDTSQIVTLVGDGAMTGGLIYEALNDAGSINKKFIMIINNNDMSISRNVGNVADYLRDLDRVRQPFREYGISYYGSVDGHCLEDLITAFRKAKDSAASIIINVHTQKGKGYKEAEMHPDIYHSYSPVLSDESFSSRMGKKLLEIAKKHPDVFAITAAMADGTGLDRLRDVLPKQFADVGIAEEHALCMASGMAISGKKPYFAVYSSFLQRAYDQVIHDMCLNDCAVTLCIDRAGFIGGDGETHQGLYDVSFLRAVPGITIFAPKDYEELDNALDWSVSYTKPLAIRYPKYNPVTKYASHTPVTLGKWEYQLFNDKDTVVLAFGAVMNDLAMQAYASDPCFDIVNARFAKPLDEELLDSIAHKNIITMEDNVLSGGFGSAVLEYYNKKGISAKVLIKAAPDKIMPVASMKELLDMCGFSIKQITEDIRRFTK